MEKKKKSRKNLFQSHKSFCKPGPVPGRIYLSIFTFSSDIPFFMGEVLEPDKFTEDSSFCFSNPEELNNFQDECSFEYLLCCIPGCISRSGRRELEELLSIERSVIKPNGGDVPIYKLKFKNGEEVIYAITNTEYSAGVLVFEPYISSPFIQRNKFH